MDNKIGKIGVFTSGGDAPGMNAAIRAVVRACAFYKKEAYGIMRGYEGMIEGDLVKLVPSFLNRIEFLGLFPSNTRKGVWNAMSLSLMPALASSPITSSPVFPCMSASVCAKKLESNFA